MLRLTEVRKLRTSGLLAIVLVAAVALQAGLVRPAAGVKAGTTSESGSWNTTLRDASTLRVEFEVQPSDPNPSFLYLLSVGENRTDNNRSIMSTILWHDNRPWWVHTGYVNADEARATVRNGDQTVSQNLTQGHPEAVDDAIFDDVSLYPDPGGSRYVLTLFADPDALIKLNITMPGGGTILDVDPDTGNATLTGLPRFDTWTGARTFPGPGAAQFRETAQHESDSPMVAYGALGFGLDDLVARHFVETPEDCTGFQQATQTRKMGLYRESFECPPGTPPPAFTWSSATYLYRGHRPGELTWNGTFVDSSGGSGTFLATATFPEG